MFQYVKSLIVGDNNTNNSSSNSEEKTLSASVINSNSSSNNNNNSNSSSSTIEWINNLNKLKTNNKNKHKSNILPKLDDSDPSSSSIASNLHISHSYEDFDDTETEHILTLKDNFILTNDIKENETEDELEDIHLTQAEMNKEIQRSKQFQKNFQSGLNTSSYTALINENEENQELLAKYNEKKKIGIRLSENGDYLIALEKEKEELARKREKQLEGKEENIIYNINNENQLEMIDDFKTVKFKKKQHKSTIKHEPITNNNFTKQEEFIAPKFDELIVEDEDEQLQTALQRARKKNAKQNLLDNQIDNSNNIVDPIKSLTERLKIKHESDEINNHSENNNLDKIKVKKEDAMDESTDIKSFVNNNNENDEEVIVISSTSEFARGLQLQQSSVTNEISNNNTNEVKMKKEEASSNNSMDLDKDSEVNVKKEEERESGEISAEESAEDSSNNPSDRTIFADEPLASTGVAAALALARSRALLQNPNPIKHNKFLSSSNNIEEDYLNRGTSLKDQFRELSHAFHGNQKGLTKREKMLRRAEKEKKSLQIASQDSSKIASKLQEVQKKLNQPYIVLDKKLNPATQVLTELSQTISAAATNKRNNQAISNNNNSNSNNYSDINKKIKKI